MSVVVRVLVAASPAAEEMVLEPMETKRLACL
jgi:hypothetical protein